MRRRFLRPRLQFDFTGGLTGGVSPGHVGLLQVDANNESLSLAASGTVTLLNPDGDSSGTTSVQEVSTHSLSELVATSASGSAAASWQPVAQPAITGLKPADLQVDVTVASVFSSDPPQVGVNSEFDELSRFREIDAVEMHAS